MAGQVKNGKFFICPAILLPAGCTFNAKSAGEAVTRAQGAFVTTY